MLILTNFFSLYVVPIDHKALQGRTNGITPVHFIKLFSNDTSIRNEILCRLICQSCVVLLLQAVTFCKCKRLSVRRLRFKNSQQMHLSFDQCVNVKALNLNVIAPGKSPNTDGIHVTHTKNIRIKNCVIRTGKRTLTSIYYFN